MTKQTQIPDRSRVVGVIQNNQPVSEPEIADELFESEQSCSGCGRFTDGFRVYIENLDRLLIHLETEGIVSCSDGYRYEMTRYGEKIQI